ncbi:glycosyltransferase [Paenibacillus sp. HJL G12]|uniref:Glycosyltransferase n=1 Tax=Paenibacillus dendrobii TaxID=2691084 RepID=A0A7X3IN60_9BACL|nr:glycosyltransferase [Paenibacillus dendrobii]MWV46618.1 glycosyltransferase [Paenibacillus dendrobii]
MQKTSIVIASLSNDFEYTKESIESIRRFTEKGTFEIIVVEGGGAEEALTWLAEQTDIRSLFSENKLTLGNAWNQGAQMAVGNFVVFMHPDTIVSPQWLSSLSDALNQNQQLGAIEPLSNIGEDGQTGNLHFASMEEMLSHANELYRNNVHVEEKIVLSGFCFMLRRNTIETIGEFDVQLEGKAMIADYCLRVKLAGLSLGICSNAFVHHYGVHQIKEEQLYASYFSNKWGFSIEETRIEDSTVQLIKRTTEDTFKVLIMGRGIGGTSLKLKQLFPHAEVYGCSWNGNLNKASDLLFPFMSCTMIESSLLWDQHFDYIILNPGIEIEYVEVLPTAFALLNKGGRLITEIANANNCSLVKRILLGQGLEMGKKYWNMADIPSLFENAGFQELDFDYVMNEVGEQSASLTNELGQFVGQLPQEFDISSFLITAYKTSQDKILHTLFKELLSEPTDAVLLEIFTNSTAQILSSLERYEGPVVSILNYLGISNFEKKQLDEVLPYLTKACELDPLNSVTLINLATLMYTIGEDEAALEWLNRLEEKDEQIETWIKEIEHNIYSHKLAANIVKFLLRRIENEVDREEAYSELIMLLSKNTVSIQDIIRSVEVDIIHKTATLNRMAVNCFSSGEYDYVIPLLEKSYSLDPEDVDTLFNLGYILYKFGANRDALNFLTQIDEPDGDIIDLQKEIEVAINHEQQ